MAVLLEAIEARMHVYNMLRNIYAKEPTMAILRSLSNGKLENLSETPLIKEGARKMAVACRKVENEKELEELHAEFARLFLFGKMPAPPYESLYTSDAKTVMGDATVEVRKRYLEEGLQVKRLYSEPDDHIATELEFMFFLCKKTLKAIKKSSDKKTRELLKKQRDFMDEHLARWAPQFCDAIVNSTDNEFYEGIALLTKGFIEEDAKFLKEAD